MKTRLTLSLMAIVGLFLITGCVTSNRDLAPSEAYDGDKALFEAERYWIEADKTVEQIEAWAKRNALYLATDPDAAEFVSTVRSDADEWLDKARQAIDAYRELKTDANLKTLEGELEILRKGLQLYTKYQIESLAQSAE